MRRKQRQQPESTEEEGLVRWYKDGRCEVPVWGGVGSLAGITRLVFEASDPMFKPEIGVEVTMRLVEIRRETVESG